MAQGGVSLYHSYKNKQINRFSYSCDLRLISHVVDLAREGAEKVREIDETKWGVKGDLLLKG